MAKKKKKSKKKESAKKGKVVISPRHWDQAISAAYLLLLGSTQAETALDVGVSPRTVWDWMHQEWWSLAQLEAQQRWLKGGDALARRALLSALNDRNEYATMARYWADRRIPELRPPKQKPDNPGDNNGPAKLDWRKVVEAAKAEDK